MDNRATYAIAWRELTCTFYVKAHHDFSGKDLVTWAECMQILIEKREESTKIGQP